MFLAYAPVLEFCFFSFFIVRNILDMVDGFIDDAKYVVMNVVELVCMVFVTKNDEGLPPLKHEGFEGIKIRVEVYDNFLFK